MAVIRVVLCCGDALYSAALRALLNTQADLDVVGEEPAVAAAARLVRRETPDVAVVTGCEATSDLLGEIAPLTNVVLLGDGYAGDPLSAVARGVRAVLTGRPGSETLFAVIRMIADGSLLILPSRIGHLLPRPAGQRQPGAASVLARLTSREKEVLELLAQGLSGPDIVQKLCVSAATVRSHVHHLLAKLEVRSRSQAVAVAYQVGLIDVQQPNLRAEGGAVDTP